MLGARGSSWAFSSCGECPGAPLCPAMGALTVVASLVAQKRLWGTEVSAVTTWGLSHYVSGIQSTGSVVVTWTQVLPSMWDLPGPGMQSLSSTVASECLTPEPPGKPRLGFDKE